MFQHILVPLDESFRAEQALPVAARIARATDGSVQLVQVVYPPIDYSGGIAPVPMLTEQVVEEVMATATNYLKAVATSPRLSGIETRIEVSFGPPAQSLIAAAKAYESDLVVLCSHGRTGLTRWALGSVAHALVHHSTVPVLVLRQDAALSLSQNGAGARTLRTLVPLDGSRLSEDALNPAASLTAALAAPAQGALHLVQVVKPVPATAEEGTISELHEEAYQPATAYLASVAERLQATVKNLKLALTYSVEFGTDVASTLLSLAEDGSKWKEPGDASAYDLIAISTHGRVGLERWAMGSVTERVLNATKLPMLIVRPQKKG